VKLQSKWSIPSGEPAEDPDWSPLMKVKPVEPVSFYACIWPPANYHMDIGIRPRDRDGSCVSARIVMQNVILDV